MAVCSQISLGSNPIVPQELFNCAVQKSAQIGGERIWASHEGRDNRGQTAVWVPESLPKVRDALLSTPPDEEAAGSVALKLAGISMNAP